MNTKFFLLLCLVAAIGGIAIGVYSYGRSSQKPSVMMTPASTPEAQMPVVPTLAVGSVVDERALPPPVMPPVAATIKSVSDTMIVINGKDGEMTLPKDSSVVTVLRRVNGQTTVVTFADVAVGMAADVTVTKPGEKVNLILLQ